MWLQYSVHLEVYMHFVVCASTIVCLASGFQFIFPPTCIVIDHKLLLHNAALNHDR